MNESLPPATYSLILTAKPESLAALTEFVRKGAQEAALPEEQMRQLELLVEEVLVNISRYAYANDVTGMVTVSYAVPQLGEIEVELRDEGVAFDPLTAPPPDLESDVAQRPVGGLGIYLLKSFAKFVTYRREQGCNRLIFGISANQ